MCGNAGVSLGFGGWFSAFSGDLGHLGMVSKKAGCSQCGLRNALEDSGRAFGISAAASSCTQIRRNSCAEGLETDYKCTASFLFPLELYAVFFDDCLVGSTCHRLSQCGSARDPDKLTEPIKHRHGTTQWPNVVASMSG